MGQFLSILSFSHQMKNVRVHIFVKLSGRYHLITTFCKVRRNLLWGGTAYYTFKCTFALVTLRL